MLDMTCSYKSLRPKQPKEVEKRCWTGKVKAEDGGLVGGEAAEVVFFWRKGGPKTGYTPEILDLFLFPPKSLDFFKGQSP